MNFLYDIITKLSCNIHKISLFCVFPFSNTCLWISIQFTCHQKALQFTSFPPWTRTDETGSAWLSQCCSLMEIAASRSRVQRFCYEAADQRERNPVSSHCEPGRGSRKDRVLAKTPCVPVPSLTWRVSSKTKICDKSRVHEDTISYRSVNRRTMVVSVLKNPLRFLLHNPVSKPASFYKTQHASHEGLGRTACSRRHRGSQISHWPITDGVKNRVVTL